VALPEEAILNLITYASHYNRLDADFDSDPDSDGDLVFM
jgi:hypothetical protein